MYVYDSDNVVKGRVVRKTKGEGHKRESIDMWCGYKTTVPTLRNATVPRVGNVVESEWEDEPGVL